MNLAVMLEHMRSQQQNMEEPQECNVCGKPTDGFPPWTLTAWTGIDNEIGHSVAVWCSSDCVAKALDGEANEE